MAIMITESNSTMEFDTLGAIKVENFNGGISPIYCYARIYCIDGGLAVGIKVFEAVETAVHRVAVRLSSNNQDALTVEFSNEKNPIAFVSRPTGEYKVDPPEIDYICGDDNQGFYWGAEFFISREHCSFIDLTAKSANTFAANLYVYDPRTSGYGCAFKSNSGYGDFIIVPY